MSVPVNIPHGHGVHDVPLSGAGSEDHDDQQDALPEDSPRLSDHTAAVLRDFLTQRELLKEGAEGNPFSEDWGLSQFWYTPQTSQTLAHAVETSVEASGRVACIACPTLWHELIKGYPEVHATLFEIDARFEGYGEFHMYDYNEPKLVDDNLQGQFDLIVLDPPYLSRDCLEKMAITAQLLSHDAAEPSVILLTGYSMRKCAEELLGVRPVKFRPQHKSKLGNEFLVYTNVAAAAHELGGYDEGISVDDS